MNTTVKDIEDALFEWAPPSLAEEWDNVGLQCGDPEATVRKIVVGLDVSQAVFHFCLEHQAELVISHHPLIFKPISCLNLKDYTARLLAGFLRHNISVVSMHTNLDSCLGGVNDRLCTLLDLQATRPLMPSGSDPSAGLGRIGTLERPMSQKEFLEHVKTRLNRDWITYAGSSSGPISRVAVCSGSGSTLFDQALSQGAEAFVTAEIKHSIARQAEAADLLLVDGGHFCTERPVVRDIQKYLANVAKQRGWEVEILVFDGEHTPLSLWPDCKEA